MLFRSVLDYLQWPKTGVVLAPNQPDDEDIHTTNLKSIRQYSDPNSALINSLMLSFDDSEIASEGFAELRAMANIFSEAGYGSRIQIDPSVVRGLEYYTGPVFECELLIEIRDDDDKIVRFGSVGGGGRYDDLVARFTGQQTPATGFSIGVSRLYAALKLVGKAEESDVLASSISTRPIRRLLSSSDRKSVV